MSSRPSRRHRRGSPTPPAPPIALLGPAPNPFGVGARIDIEAGDLAAVRWIQAMSTSFMTSLPPVAHFGLGDAAQIDALEVTWPDGYRQTFRDVAASQHLTVLRP